MISKGVAGAVEPFSTEPRTPMGVICGEDHESAMPSETFTRATMWRLCDLHNHTTPNEQRGRGWDPDAFVKSCMDAGLDVIAVTDHDHTDRLADSIAAAEGKELTVIPGVEISTDRGHILTLAPGKDGLDVIRDFMSRVGAAPGHQVPLEDLLTTAHGESRPCGERYNQRVVLVGSHVDAAGSLLATSNQLGVEGQLQLAQQLHALEVCRDEVLEDWANNGVKQGPHLSLIRASDMHDPSDRVARATWLYLPDISAEALRHALALPEASIRYDAPEVAPTRIIESISFTGGHHDGLHSTSASAPTP